MPKLSSGFVAETPNNFFLHKDKESPSDYQDAHSYNLPNKRYAIADGSTGAFFSAVWANLLVDRFCNHNDESNTRLFEHQGWEIWLHPIQTEWQKEIKIRATNPDAKYHISNRYTRKDAGAATFVGLELNPAKMEWRTMIIGDSCLFHIQQERLKASCLIDNSRLFNTDPDYFSSINKPDYQKKPTFITGNLTDGDFLVLVTDAFAKWMLFQHELGNWENVWNDITQMNWEQFYKLIEEKRLDAKFPLENDDITLSIIPIGKKAKNQLCMSLGKSEIISKKLPNVQPRQSSEVLNKFFTLTSPEEKALLPKTPVRPIITKRPDEETHNTQRLNQIISRKQQSLEKVKKENLLLRRWAISVSILLVLNLFLSAFFVFSNTRKTMPISKDPVAVTPIPERTRIPVLLTLSPTATAPIVPTPELIEKLMCSMFSTPSPISDSDFLLLLEPGMDVYSDVTQGDVIALIEHETEVLLLEVSGNQEWSHIQFDVWSIRPPSSMNNILWENETVNVSKLPVYALSASIGRLYKGFDIQKVNECQTDTGGAWYQYRIIGFVYTNTP